MEMVSVAVAALAPATVTGVVEPKLNAGRSCAPAGLAVRAAVREMLPVKPPPGVTVTVEVLPVVVPGAKLIASPLSVKLGGVTAVSPIEVETLAPKLLSPG